MKAKKNPKADLEKMRTIFFLIGLTIALGAVFAAFNTSSQTSAVEELERIEEPLFEDEEITPTRQKEEIQITPPPPQQIVEVLQIVDDNEDIDEEFIPQNTDTDEDEEIPYHVPVVKPEVDEEPIFVIVEIMPEPLCGQAGLLKYISSNINYPNIAREQGIEGKVFVRFCVTKTGKVEKVSIARGADPILDKEAVRVIKTLPDWKPGEQGGRKVNVWYTVPIVFQLGN